MLAVLIAVSIAAAMTAIFAFRFRVWGKPWTLVGYFALFQALELLAQSYWIPPGALGVEVALVCFAIAMLFAVASSVAKRAEERN